MAAKFECASFLQGSTGSHDGGFVSTTSITVFNSTAEFPDLEKFPAEYRVQVLEVHLDSQLNTPAEASGHDRDFPRLACHADFVLLELGGIFRVVGIELCYLAAFAPSSS